MGRQSFGIIALTVAILLLGAYVAFGPWSDNSPIVPRSRQSALFTSSLSSAKQVALAMLMYQADYDDVMPPNMNNPTFVEMVTDPYMKNRSLWTSNNPAGARFLPNEELSLVTSYEIVHPERAPMIYESKEWSDGRRIIAYADGHTKGVTGFVPTTGLKVELTQKGKDLVAKAKAASTVRPAASPAAKPLGMPGN